MGFNSGFKGLKLSCRFVIIFTPSGTDDDG